MIRFNDPLTARPSRTQGTISGGGTNFVTNYLTPDFPEAGDGVFPLPQAYAVEQTPQSASLAHFHDEDQFQVITHGGGTLGRHAVGALSIHYTNRQTAYGPIVAGDNGLRYFTLRQVGSKGTWFLADAKTREILDKSLPKRQETRGPIHPVPEHALRDPGSSQVDVLIEPHEDGLAAWMVRVPIGLTVTSPVHPAGTGRYFFVVGGSMQVGEKELPADSITFVSHDEKDFGITAGRNGAEVLVMQYPGGQRVLERRAKPLSQQGLLKSR